MPKPRHIRNKRAASRLKQPQSLPIGQPTKQPRSVDLSTLDHGYIIWSFTEFDPCRLWAKDCEPVDFAQVAGKLKSYQSMPWDDIVKDKRRDHPSPPHELSDAAQCRLLELDKGDVELLWRLRFTGKQRLWGIRSGPVFRVLWWDPDHRVYPVRKE